MQRRARHGEDPVAYTGQREMERGLSRSELKQAKRIVAAQLDYMLERWHDFFKGIE